MTDGLTWLAEPGCVAYAGHYVVLARGLSLDELTARLSTALLYRSEHVVVPVGKHTGASLLDLIEERYGDHYDGIGLRLGRTGEWSYAVAYGGWPSEFGPLTSVSEDGTDVCVLEYEEMNGKPVPPHFAYLRDGRAVSVFNMHLDASWGYDGIDGDPGTAARLERRLAAAGLPDQEREGREVYRVALGVVGEFFGLSLPEERIVSGALPAVLLEPAA
ncbi:hypothetical protein [Streptomyces sp. NPDC056600]|uniref:hypothetical protein n=1 Tax=Streptomyces sp. NPDC056600 TaxID=3345874 RepID=UPI00368A85A7